MKKDRISRDILSDITVFSKYAKHLPSKKRRETWEEIVDRNKDMHIKKFPDIKDEIDEAYQYVYNKQILPSMRSMQFAGKPIEISPSRIYNCSYMPMDDIEAFNELMFLLLCGCGVGYSVQMHHVAKLPEVIKPKKTRRYLISDSIEGWADAIKVLVKAYIGTRSSLPVFDFSDIRTKGELLKTSGGRAPGPAPLKKCLQSIEAIFEEKQTGEKLSPIEVHDICCYIADAVLAGGIRRSAMIALFSLGDQEMMSSKFGDWTEKNPQRGRANNSVLLLRHKITRETFLELWEKMKEGGTGEPGICFTNDKEWGFNPCVEISCRANQFCNVVTIDASTIVDQFDYNTRAKAAAFIATLQASYTNFHYLREIWQTTTEKEALIGVSMTGIASSSVMDLDMREAAKIVITENERAAKLIGINKAARCTTVKPEGTASSVVGSSSGIHAWHGEYYIRRMRISKEEPIHQYLIDKLSDLIEDDFYKPHLESILSLPIKAPEGAVLRGETSLQFLNRVKKVYTNWIKPGHRSGHNTHNISATVNVKTNEWDRVCEWMWANRENYTALSVFPYDDTSYVQPPFEEIDEKTYKKMLKSLHEIDLSEVKETQDKTKRQDEIACAGNACEIT